MKSWMFLTLVGFGANLGLAEAAQPAISLEVLQGTVLVGTQDGFKPVTGIVAVRPADKIVVRDKAAAVLSIDGSACFLSLREAGVYVVPKKSLCEKTASAVLPPRTMMQRANDAYPMAAAGAPPVASGLQPLAIGMAVPAVAAGAFAFSTLLRSDQPEVDRH